jgi:hypothetical protein
MEASLVAYAFRKLLKNQKLKIKKLKKKLCKRLPKMAYNPNLVS